jgi:hypothetical protein
MCVLGCVQCIQPIRVIYHNEIVITIFFTFSFEFFFVKDKKKTYKGDNTKNIIRDSNLPITHL